MQNKKTTKKKKPKKTQANKQKLKNNKKTQQKQKQKNTKTKKKNVRQVVRCQIKVNCFTNGKRTYFQTLLKTKKYWSKRAQ